MIKDCDYNCVNNYQRDVGKSAYNMRGVVLQAGINTIVFIGEDYRTYRDMLQHEFTHNFGMRHQKNAPEGKAGSITSYSEIREILTSDRVRLYNAYHSALGRDKDRTGH